MTTAEEKRLPNLFYQQLEGESSRSVPRLGLPPFVYDYQLCDGDRALEECLRQINEAGWSIIAVTEPQLCTFHIFFRRPAYG